MAYLDQPWPTQTRSRRCWHITGCASIMTLPQQFAPSLPRPPVIHHNTHQACCMPPAPYCMPTHPNSPSLLAAGSALTELPCPCPCLSGDLLPCHVAGCSAGKPPPAPAAGGASGPLLLASGGDDGRCCCCCLGCCCKLLLLLPPPGLLAAGAGAAAAAARRALAVVTL